MKGIIKIFFAVLTALSAASSAQAQKLTVESMTMEPMDLSASKYVRNDLNGKACALVKVQIPLEGMVFEGNVMGDVENKTGEYWVYLTAGTKKFLIKHKSVLPMFVTFADYGLEPLSGRTTYVLRLAAPASAASAQPMEEVTFKVTPADAVLIVDDEERDVLDGSSKVMLTHGLHKCSVSHPGYKAVSDEFVVKNGMPKRIYELDPKAGSTPAIASTQVPAPAIDVAAIRAEADKAYDDGYYNRALELYMKLSDDPKAQYQIGEIHYYGKGVNQDFAEAERWFRKAAEQEYAAAQYMLGNMYYWGQGVTQDFAEAVRWFRKAAEQEYAAAQCSLGWVYERGLGVTPDYAEAVRWFRKAAEQGEVLAQCVLGRRYEDGQGVTQDFAEAARWYRKAAEQGNAGAQYNLGHMYYLGNGVTKDYAEAVRWFHKAADQEYTAAQYMLGEMYYRGQGVTEDYAEAARWFHKAADQGNAGAQCMLGYLYYRGQGVTQDRQEAYRWIKKAADAGDKDAKKFIAENTF